MNNIRLAIALIISFTIGSFFLVTNVQHYYDIVFAADTPSHLIHTYTTQGLSLTALSPLLVGMLLGSTLSVALYNALRFLYTGYLSNLLFALALSCLLLFLFFTTHLHTFAQVLLLNSEGDLTYNLVILSLLFLHLMCLKCIPTEPELKRLTPPLFWHMGLLCLSFLSICLVSSAYAQIITYYALISSSLVLLSCSWQLWHQHNAASFSLGLGLAVLLLPILSVWPCLIGACFLSTDTTVLLMLSSLAVSAFIISIALSQSHRQKVAQRADTLRIQAAEDAERRAKSELLAKISHEVRTPLSGVLGMTTLLLDTPLSSKQRDYVHTIQGSGNELLSLINEILDISRLESNEVVLSKTPFSLADLLQECAQAFANRAQEQQVELTVFLQPQAPEIILGDPIRLRQMILSMLTNAFQRTRHGEVVLSITTEQQDQAEQLLLTVHDTGTPLSDQERHILSTAQLHSKDLLSASFIGGNLGIIIARQLITLMGGTFNISRRPQGTVFTVKIPAHTQRNSVSHGEADILRQQPVLIIDNNALSQKVLAQQCSQWGMLVSTRSSIPEAIALLRNRGMQGQRFKAIIISETTHNPTAMAFAMRVKDDPVLTADSSLIMLSSSSQINSTAARHAGIHHILMKPVSGSTLKTTLITALRNSTQATPSLEHGASKHILVAEDDPISVKVISGLLNKLGATIDVAANGQIALAMLQKKRYDLVLMDCEMPVMDGFTAAQQYRAYEAAQGLTPVPIIALSAHVLEEHHLRAQESGMDGHLAKPIELAKLQAIVRGY